VPKYKAFCSAENETHTLHNVLTPRGAKVRDAKAWAYFLDEAIDLFGDKTEVVFPSHHWPIFGHERSIKFLEDQRDLYKYIHDQTVHLANKGFNMDEIAETIKLPDELGKQWYNQGFYGTVQHNSKAVYQFYLGWWDGNPANYNKLPEVEAKNLLVTLKNGVLHYKENKPDVLADFTLTISKQKFIEGLADRARFREIVLGNDVKREGNIFKLRELFENVEKFDPNWNIVLPL